MCVHGLTLTVSMPSNVVAENIPVDFAGSVSWRTSNYTNQEDITAEECVMCEPLTNVPIFCNSEMKRNTRPLNNEHTTSSSLPPTSIFPCTIRKDKCTLDSFLDGKRAL